MVPTVGGERELISNRYTVTTVLLLIQFNVRFTEVVPTFTDDSWAPLKPHGMVVFRERW